ncbi:hypothetical protein [Polaribacter sp.]|uniref:hypothetical protein n=1 Tax=Polaribacter sp. TaxID=1920175 RepID=UPI003BB1AD5A
MTLIFIISLYSNAIKACQCKPISFDKQIEFSDRIFVGQVTNITNSKYTFRLISEWVSNETITKSATIEIEQGSNSCATRNFDLNTIYLVYMKNSEVSNCSRTKEFQETNDIERLSKLEIRKFIIYDLKTPEYEKINYNRKYIVNTNEGEIDIKDKKVLFINKGKIVSRKKITSSQVYLYNTLEFQKIDYIFFIVNSNNEKFKPKIKRKLKKEIIKASKQV